MSLYGVTIIGLVMGALSKLIFLRTAPGGWLLPLMIGMAGSMSAGYLALTFAWHPEQEPGCSAIAAILGAGLLLIGYRLDVSRSRAKPGAKANPDVPVHAAGKR